MGATAQRPYCVGFLGRTYPEEVLSRVLYATQFTRHLDQHGYVRFKKWRFFGEDGLAGGAGLRLDVRRNAQD